MFSKLITDESPMVRAAAAKALPLLGKSCPKNVLMGEFLHFKGSLCSDENEAVKVVAVGNLRTYAELMISVGASPEERQELLNTVRNAALDPSWRVRTALSQQLGYFSTFFAPDRVLADLLMCGITLIQDSEIEVRTVAITGMSKYYSMCGNMFLTEFVPIAKMLLEDPQPGMRKGLSDVCVDVAAEAGPEIAANYFNELIIKLLSDPDPMVRIRVLMKLRRIAEYIPSLCIRLVATLRQFFSDQHWRTRQELCKAMPAVIKFLGVEFFTDHFLAEFLITFKDDVHDVRFTTCDSLTELMQASGLVFIYVILEQYLIDFVFIYRF
jgi:serine/threonine-protein phosphatase 2A regulatory subunit A